MGSIGQSSSLGPPTELETRLRAEQEGRVPFSQQSRFRRGLAAFGGNFGQLAAEEQGLATRQAATTKATAAQQKTVFDSATKTLTGLAKELPKLSRQDATILLNSPSFQQTLVAIQENMESVRPGSSQAVMPTIRAAFLQSKDPETVGAAAGQQKVAEAGVTGVPPGGTNFKNVIFPTGEQRIVNMSDPEAVKNLPEGSQVFTAQVQPATPAGLGVPTRAGRGAARAAIAESTDNIFAARDVLRNLETAAGASGISGTIAEFGGGLLSQLPVVGEGAEEAFTRFIAGASPKEVADFRSDARLFAARMLSTITKEEGRFSEPERAEARRIVRALTPEASIPQIRTAVKNLITLDVINREAKKIEGGGAALSVFTQTATPELVAREAVKLQRFGFDPEESLDLAIRLFEQMSDLAEQLSGGR